MILTAGGVALTAFVRLPTWTLPLIVLDSPLTLQLTGTWVVAGVLGVLVCAGTDVLVRLEPSHTAAPFTETVRYWVLPGLMAVATVLLTAKLTPWTGQWWLALMVVAVGIGGVEWMLHCSFRGTHPYSELASLVLTVASYGLALTVFTAVYAARVRTALSGSAIGLTAALLAMWLFSSSEPLDRRSIVPGVAVGLLTATATWVLNHHPVPAIVGGALLLLLFYLLTSFVQAYRQGQLTWRTVAELVAVAVVVLLLIIGLRPE